MSIDLPYGSILFAPMEGVTDPLYRSVVQELCPGWDVMACDFLRVPSAGKYPLKHLIKHMGQEVYDSPELNKQTMFQILTSERAFTQEMVELIATTKIQWLDLNLGCPSNTVCGNGGGSFLLKDLKVLARIVTTVRKSFPRRFTCKVRIGWENGASFEDTIKLLNDCGAEMITVHGRTREMMYKEPAQWEWIAKAVAVSKVPIVGNGDVWNAQDAKRMLIETGCHAVMVARGALQTPWFPAHYYQNQQDTPVFRAHMAQKFILRYAQKLIEDEVSEQGVVKQLKSVTRFMFDGLPQGEIIRRSVLLSQSYQQIYQTVQAL